MAQNRFKLFDLYIVTFKKIFLEFLHVSHDCEGKKLAVNLLRYPHFDMGHSVQFLDQQLDFQDAGFCKSHNFPHFFPSIQFNPEIKNKKVLYLTKKEFGLL